MKTFLIFIGVIFLVFITKNVILKTHSDNKLNRNIIYFDIKSIIKKGMTRKNVYKILNKEELKYHIDKNRDIEITGKGITIEINRKDKVVIVR